MTVTLETMKEDRPSPAVNGVSARGSRWVVDRVNPLEMADWDKLLVSHPQASFFHCAAWARTLNRAYRFTPSYYLVRQDDRLLALLPVMEADTLFGGRRGVSLPFTDECPLISSPDVSLEKPYVRLLDEARQRRWKYLEFRGPSPLFADAPPFLSFHTHTLSLRPADGLFARLKEPVRRAIRKAERQGLEIAVSRDLAAVRDYYHLHCLTRRRHGLPPQPWAFFRTLQEEALSRGLGRVILARSHDQPVAGAVFLCFGSQAIYKFGASDGRFQRFRPSNLVMWRGIQEMAAAGLATLHLGRTSLANEGLRRFKLGWGSQEDRLDYFRRDLRRDLYVSGQDRAEGWQNRVFRLFPVPLLRLCGELLYRHMA